ARCRRAFCSGSPRPPIRHIGTARPVRNGPAKVNAMIGELPFFLNYIIPFLAVLTVIVFVHEMGHYLVARWNGIAIDAFSIGFGPELFGWNDKRGTRWRVAAFPLGGYVKFAGDANAASMPDPDAAE